jgi:hypothetical protein
MSFNEFENDYTVKNIIKKLNEDYPNWYIKKDILEEILRKIESIKLENFHSLNQIRDTILKVLDEAKVDDRIHYDISDEVVIEICNDEKKKFYDYINNIRDEDLTNIIPIFYRRVLSESIVTEIKEKINTVRYTTSLEKEMHVCFKHEDFEGQFGIYELVDILRKHGANRIYEINTGGISTASYIMDLSAFNPYYIDGFDIYWCTEQLDWLIIKDHEGYYIIYGEWLINELKCLWNDWEKYTECLFMKYCSYIIQ